MSKTRDKRMLVKFENKSNRVKGLSFHPKRPWILASLHNGIIQLWDYRMEIMIDKFAEHDGPVRGINFHSSQPLFVSGGDDYKIKVWNYQLKRCLFNLLGHLDYIRTVQFHHTYPWVLSASDDQTIRIWNWQSRTGLSVLTGHNHYVMCARFHPRQDLVLSASLDQTVRVWDVSGLRKKNVSIAGDYGNTAMSAGTADIFGQSDVVVKHELTGHQRGVNWASFHPVLSLIVTGADDREVKLWRMNEHKVWEVDTMRGHINNVSCVLFHPRKELILSNSEDKSIRIWDISKQASPQVLRRESDRYWILDAHPSLNLLAAGHDSGMIVFKLHRERPPFHSSGKRLFYYKGQYIYEYEFKSGRENPILSTRRRGSPAHSGPRTLDYNFSNRSQHCILLTNPSDNTYELYTMPKDNKNNSGNNTGDSNMMRGSGVCAVFTSRNRFAVLDKLRQVWLKTLSNETKRKLKIPGFCTQIFTGGLGRLLLRCNDGMVLYDVQAFKVLAKLPIHTRHPIKYVVWSRDMKRVAMFSKTHIYLADNQLRETCRVSENTRVKSGSWDAVGVFVYTTSTHLKYLLPNGDGGVIRTLESPLYITSIANNQINYLNRYGKTGTLQVDATEYLFKIALLKRNRNGILKIMESKKLVGKSIIAYLQAKGEPEVALHFVDDKQIKFELALECGNIDAALECADQLDDNDCWSKLGVEALRQGNHEVVEHAYQKTQNFERLSFLYLITGNLEKLKLMLRISGLRQDLMSRFHNSLYLGDVQERVAVLRDAGQLGLALVTAIAHGLTDLESEIRQILGDDVPELPDLSAAKLMLPSIPILREANWPLHEMPASFFKMGDASQEELKADEFQDPDDLGLGGDVPDEIVLDSEKDEDEDEDAAGDSGWPGMLDIDIDLGDDFEGLDGLDDAELTGDADGYVLPLAGKSADDKWAKSQVASDLIAAGAFDMAMHKLNRQIGVVNFDPLKANFLKIVSSSHCLFQSLPMTPGTLSGLYRSRQDDEDLTQDLPVSVFSLQHCLDSLKHGYKAVLDGKFSKGLDYFTNIIHTIPLVTVERKNEVQDVLDLVDVCREYITAIRLEMKRKSETDKGKQATLAALFTHTQLQHIHTALGLRVAIKLAFSIKNYKTTGLFCRRIIELCSSSPQKATVAKVTDLKKIKKILVLCERQNSNQVDLKYDSSSVTICCKSLAQIPKGHVPVRCPYCQSAFLREYEGQVCTTCNLSQIGADTSGLQLFV